MRSKKRILSLFMTFFLITALPAQAMAAPAEEWAEVDDETPIQEVYEESSSDNGSDYVEGSVIVLVKEGDDSREPAPDDTDSVSRPSLDAALSLLDAAEEIMDVTGAVQEELSEAGMVSGVSEADPDAAGVKEKLNALYDPDDASDDEYKIKFITSDTYSTEELLELVSDIPSVIFAEPDRIYCCQDSETEEAAEDVTEADDHSVYAPALYADDTGEPEEEIPDLTGYQYAFADGAGGVNVPLWNTPSYLNSEGAVIALFDTGVDYTHPDLKDVMWDRGLLYPALKKLGGGEFGYNALEGEDSSDPMDDNSHGTHCAGIIGAAWNSYGISGITNGAKIMAVKSGDANRTFYGDSILRGYSYIKAAKESGVNIAAANNSWSSSATSYTVALALKELGKLGIVTCFSSGNAKSDVDLNCYPISLLREDNAVITVNSNDSSGSVSDFSNYGIRSSDVSAPGTGILSTIPVSMSGVDPDLCLPVKDVSGNFVKDDFSAGETYYTYQALGDSSIETVDDETGRALMIGSLSANEAFVEIRGGALSSVPRYLAMRARSSELNTTAVFLQVLMRDGSFETVRAQTYLTTSYSSSNIYRLPENMNIETPIIRMESRFHPNRPEAASVSSLYIDSISLTDNRSVYGYKDGTSMSAPAVSGEVAILAARWPEDDAERLTARVVGSASYREVLQDTSRTGGIADVKRALSCSYSPVIDGVFADENGLLHVTGYFFGTENGSISIKYNGKTLGGDFSVKQWKARPVPDWNVSGINEKDEAVFDTGIDEDSPDYPAGEIYVTITSSEGRSGSAYVEMRTENGAKRTDNCYTELNLPADEAGRRAFNRTNFSQGAALGGCLYFAGSVYKEDITYVNTMWKYTLPTEEEPEGRWEISDTPVQINDNYNLCAWNKMLVYVSSSDRTVKLYDPEKNAIRKTDISIKKLNANTGSAYLVNAAGRLYLFLTVQEPDESMKYADSRTEVYRIDMEKMSAYKIHTLETLQKQPVLYAEETRDGGVCIYSLSGKDDTKILLEKTIIDSTGEVVTASCSSETVELPENCGLYGQTLRGTAVPYGIVLTGLVDKSDMSDNFLYSFEDGRIHKLSKQIAPGRPMSVKTVSYKEKTYFLCLDPYKALDGTFAYAKDSMFKGDSAKRDPLKDYGDEDAGFNPKAVYVTDLNSSGLSTDLISGKTLQLAPAHQKSGTEQLSYNWYSSNALIADVDKNGKVTGHNTGKASINAYAYDQEGNRFEGSLSVTVLPKATSLKLDNTKITAGFGTSFELKATAYPSNVPGEYIEWEVNCPGSYTGLIEKTEKDPAGCSRSAIFTLGNPGETVKATITARMTDGSNKKASCTVTIGTPASDLILKQGNRRLGSDEKISLNAGKSITLKGEITPSTAAGKSVTWISDDTEVATVKNGKITAAGAGSARITAAATDGTGISASCIVNVNAPVTKVSLSEKGTIKLGKGMSHGLCLTGLTPFKSSPYRVDWKSSNPAVTVSGNETGDKALIYGADSGTAKITAVITNTVPGGKETVTSNALTVKVTQSAMSSDEIRIYKGNTDLTGTENNRLAVKKSLTLKPVLYRNGSVIKKAEVIWESSDPEKAGVSGGKVNALKEGEVTITAYAIPEDPEDTSTVKASIKLYVYNPVTRLQITEDADPTGKLTKVTGAQFKLYPLATVAAASAGDDVREPKRYIWSSSADSVVSVTGNADGSATLKTNSAGSATITVLADDGSGKSAKCAVTVLANVTEITLTAKNLGNASVDGYNSDEITVSNLAVGKSFTISPLIAPADASNRSVVYSSTNPSIISVNDKGVVTRRSEGSADINVITVDGGKKAVCHVL